MAQIVEKCYCGRQAYSIQRLLMTWPREELRHHQSCYQFDWTILVSAPEVLCAIWVCLRPTWWVTLNIKFLGTELKKMWTDIYKNTFSGHSWFPSQRTTNAKLSCFLVVILNNLLNKQPSWVAVDLMAITWHHCNNYWIRVHIVTWLDFKADR